MRSALPSFLVGFSASAALTLGVLCSSAMAAPLAPGEWRLANAGVNRIDAAMAYDPSTGKVLLFGGRLPSWSMYTDDTWELDPATFTWTKLRPAHQPPARRNAVMAFDPNTSSIILVGGSYVWNGVSKVYDDTWQWTGTDWKDITPTGGDPIGPRWQGAMTTVNGGLLLVGGVAEGTEPIDGTWTWDGKVWKRAPVTAPAPAATIAPLLASRSVDGSALFFMPGDTATEVWRWDGAWTDLTDAASPPVKRLRPSLAYMGWGDTFLLFGGRPTGSSTYAPGGSWEVAATSALDGYSEMLTVSTGDSLIAFGGLDDSGIDRPGVTWSNEDGAWHSRAMNTGRCDASMAYDRLGKRVLRFGGSLRCAGLTDPSEDAITRAWDGDNWVDVGETPSDLYPRAGAMMASLGDEVILVGGANGSTFGDTWRWTGASWVPVEVSDDAPRVAFGAMAYDGQGLVLFGGLDESVTQGQTWRFDGSKWSLADSATSPPPAYGNAMAYDAERGDVVMFGGMDDSGLLPGETWVWHGATGQWESLGVLSPSPSARAFAAMSYDQARRRVVLFGGQLADGFPANPEGQPEAWEWDGSGWTDVSSDAEAEERGHAAMAYDEAAGALVLFGGSYSSTATQPFHANGDTWVFAARGDGTGGCQRNDGAGMVSLPDGALCPGGECVAGACVQDPSAPKPDYGSPSGGTSGAGGDASSGSSGVSAGQGGVSAEDPDGAASSGCSVGGTGGASAPAASVALLAATLTWLRRRRRTA